MLEPARVHALSIDYRYIRTSYTYYKDKVSYNCLHRKLTVPRSVSVFCSSMPQQERLSRAFINPHTTHLPMPAVRAPYSRARVHLGQDVPLSLSFAVALPPQLPPLLGRHRAPIVPSHCCLDNFCQVSAVKFDQLPRRKGCLLYTSPSPRD